MRRARGLRLVEGLEQPWTPSWEGKFGENPFGLNAPGDVTLSVYDAGGRLVKTLLAGEAHEAGRHEVIWNGKDNADTQVSSGVYFYRLEAGAFTETRKMTLLK